MQPYVLAFLATVALAPASQAEGIGGWDKLKWGMTQQEASAAYSNFHEYQTTEFNPLTGKWGPVRNFGLQSYATSGCDFYVDLQFHENRLDSIMLTQQDIVNYEICKKSTQSALMHKYGDSPLQEAISGVYFRKWKIGSTTITYAYHDRGAGSFVSINYMNLELKMNLL